MNNIQNPVLFKVRQKTSPLHSHEFAKSLNEKILAYVVISFFGIYILSYGLITNFQFNLQWSLTYFSIIPLMFAVDGFKSLFEIFKGKIVTGKEESKKITFIIPSYNGEDTIEQVIKNILIRFNRNQIIVVSNGSTDNTVTIAKKYPVQVVEIKQPVGKERAIQSGVKAAKSPYIITMDDDTLINDALIPTSLLDDGYGAVGFRVLPENGTWVSTIQQYEYLKSMDIGKTFSNTNGTVDCVSGAIGLFKREELLRQETIHTAEFSGEDLQRTLHIHHSGNSKGVVLCSSTVRTIVPQTITELFNQRIFGWFPGLYANFGLFWSILFSKKSSLSMRWTAFYNIILVNILDLFRILAFPILIFNPYYFLVMFLIYFILDTIIYLKLKEKTPYWVVLINCIYGIFGLVTRLGAISVFLYRRSVVKLKDAEWLDDHRKAPFWIRYSSVVSILIVFIIYFFVAILFKINNYW